MAKLLSSLANGTLVKFGKHQVNTETPQDIIWMVVDKNHSGYPSNSVTLIAQKIIDLRAFDAKQKPYYPDEEDYSVNYFYKASNLHQWLNSDAKVGEWYYPYDTYDQPPTADTVTYGTQYEERAGFLYNFTSNEKLALLPTTFKIYAGSKLTSMTTEVFVPSVREVFGAEGIADESTRFAYFLTNGAESGLTSNAYNNTLSTYKPKSVDGNWSYWTRSTEGTARPIIIYVNGQSSDDVEYDGSIGVRPVINLSGNERISDNVDGENCYTIKFNTAPVIDDSNKDLGIKSTGFTQTYKVTDVDADSVTVKEYIDNALIRSHVVTLGTTYTTSITDATWLKLGNGIHTIKIVANDGYVDVTRTYTFTKNVTGFEVVKKVPYDSTAMPTQIRVSVVRNIPDGATFKVEVCNNGYDTSPTWKDITAYVISGDIYDFENTTKTAAKWGVNIRVTVERGTASGACYITEIGGNFE